MCGEKYKCKCPTREPGGLIMKEPKVLSRLRRKTTVENLWMYVIASLLAEGPTYAYRLRGIIEKNFGFKPSTVTLYSVIYRMEREGLLQKNNDLYMVTDLGVQALSTGISMLEDMIRKLKETIREGGSLGP
jgi:PadR family transcriptional regulator PadR